MELPPRRSAVVAATSSLLPAAAAAPRGGPRRQLVLQPEPQPAQPGLHRHAGRLRGGGGGGEEGGDGQQGALLPLPQGRAARGAEWGLPQAGEARTNPLAQDGDGIAGAGQPAAAQPEGDDTRKFWRGQDVIDLYRGRGVKEGDGNNAANQPNNGVTKVDPEVMLTNLHLMWTFIAVVHRRENRV